MNFDYRHIPSEFGYSMPDQIQRLSNELSKAYAAKLNSWLGECVEKFCPAAFLYQSSGNLISAARVLNEEEFHYRTHPDGVTEFCCGDTVLAKAKFETVFKTERKT